jgi:hypothetical protein
MSLLDIEELQEAVEHVLQWRIPAVDRDMLRKALCLCAEARMTVDHRDRARLLQEARVLYLDAHGRKETDHG